MYMSNEDIKKRVGAFPATAVRVCDVLSLVGIDDAFPVDRIDHDERTGMIHFHSHDPLYLADVIVVPSASKVRGWFSMAGNLPERIKARSERLEGAQGDNTLCFQSILADYQLKAPVTVMREHSRWMRQCEDVRIEESGKGWILGQSTPIRPIMFIKNKKMAEAALVLWRRICKEFIG